MIYLQPAAESELRSPIDQAETHVHILANKDNRLMPVHWGQVDGNSYESSVPWRCRLRQTSLDQPKGITVGTRGHQVEERTSLKQIRFFR